MNSEESCRQFHYLYAVEFGQKRILRPESMKFVLGRSKCSDFVISSGKVPRKQCELICSASNWMLHNLSPEGTPLVGQMVVRDEAVELGPETILKIGGIYIQFKSEVEPAKYPLRILKINVLIGEKYCSLVDDSELQPDEPIGRVIPESLENSNVEIPTESSWTEELAKANVVIADLISENKLAVQELKEAKAALEKALADNDEAQLKAAEKEEQLKLFFESMEAEFQCSICNEILIDAVTIGCSHTFCEYCLLQWKKKNRICPLCRGSIHQECKTRIVDNIIDKMIGNIPDDAQKRRKELADARKVAKRQSKSHSRGRQGKRRRMTMMTLGDPVHELVRISFNYTNVVDETINISSDDDAY